MNTKEKNFISAVVYLHNDGERAVEFCRAVSARLEAHFAQFELIAVDDACTDDTVVPVQNSILFYMGLKENNVPAEMHIYPSGGHGWGFSSKEITGHDSLGYARSEFFSSLARWMDARLAE